MRKSLYLMLILSFAVLYGCKKGVTVASAPSTVSVSTSAAAVQAVEAPEQFVPSEGNYNTVTQCPVMGEKVTVAKDTIGMRYKGKDYYLCCPSCVKMFKENPEKYIMGQPKSK